MKKILFLSAFALVCICSPAQQTWRQAPLLKLFYQEGKKAKELEVKTFILKKQTRR